MQLTSMLCTCVAASLAASPAIAQGQADAPPDEPAPIDQILLEDSAPAREPFDFYSVAEDEAFYVKISGLFSEPQNDGFNELTSEPIEFDDGAGISLGIGYTLPDAPVSVEFEWIYREFDVDSDSAQPSDGDISLNAFAANILLDQANIIGPVGAYAGLGAGILVNRFKFTSTGGSSSLAIDGEGFYWQAMAGVTVSLGIRTQIFGGVRFSDGGTIEDEGFRFDTETVDYEIGLRLFF